jgi:hypothetical protein
MKYRQALTIENKAEGRWDKRDLEFDENDLVDLAIEHDAELLMLSTTEKFRFLRAGVARLLCADLLASGLSHPGAAALKASAETELARIAALSRARYDAQNPSSPPVDSARMLDRSHDTHAAGSDT